MDTADRRRFAVRDTIQVLSPWRPVGIASGRSNGSRHLFYEANVFFLFSVLANKEASIALLGSKRIRVTQASLSRDDMRAIYD